MSESVVLPALGESVTEGTVTRWLKKVGDSVSVDEPLVEVSTDKVDTEIPSPVSGVIEQILVQEDETVQVGAVLVIIGSGSASSAAVSTPEAATPAVSVQPIPSSEPIAAEPAPVVTAAPVIAAPAAPTASRPAAATSWRRPSSPGRAATPSAPG